MNGAAKLFDFAATGLADNQLVVLFATFNVALWLVTAFVVSIMRQRQRAWLARQSASVRTATTAATIPVASQVPTASPPSPALVPTHVHVRRSIPTPATSTRAPLVSYAGAPTASPPPATAFYGQPPQPPGARTAAAPVVMASAPESTWDPARTRTLLAAAAALRAGLGEEASDAVSTVPTATRLPPPQPPTATLAAASMQAAQTFGATQAPMPRAVSPALTSAAVSAAPAPAIAPVVRARPPVDDSFDDPLDDLDITGVATRPKRRGVKVALATITLAAAGVAAWGFVDDDLLVSVGLVPAAAPTTDHADESEPASSLGSDSEDRQQQAVDQPGGDVVAPTAKHDPPPNAAVASPSELPTEKPATDASTPADTSAPGSGDKLTIDGDANASQPTPASTAAPDGSTAPTNATAASATSEAAAATDATEESKPSRSRDKSPRAKRSRSRSANKPAASKPAAPEPKPEPTPEATPEVVPPQVKQPRKQKLEMSDSGDPLG